MGNFNNCVLKCKYRYGDNYEVVLGHQVIADCSHYQDFARLFTAAPEMYELLYALVHREYDNTITAILTSKAKELLERIDSKEVNP